MRLPRGFPWMTMVAGGVTAGLLAFAITGVPGRAAVAAEGAPPVTTATAPTTTTTTSTTLPPEPTTTVPAVGELVIQGVGDVSFDPAYITAFREVGYEAAFEGLDGFFLEDDLTVINLECPASTKGAPIDKAYSFSCDPAAIPVAAANGVEVANLANNHGLDRGREGLLDSIDVLRSAGIAPVGVGSDLAEAMRPALFELSGRTVAVVGMGGVVPGEWWLATEDGPGMASGDDIEQMVASVEAAAAQADIVVVTVHWGRELVAEPDAWDRERAEAMVAAGADVIFGHHPHRLGELEFVDGVPVFWTLGNFVWPRLSDAGATTAVAQVRFAADGALEACLVPAFIEESGRPQLRGEPECETP